MNDPYDEDYDADLEECIDWQARLTLTAGRATTTFLIEWLTARPQWTPR